MSKAVVLCLTLLLPACGGVLISVGDPAAYSGLQVSSNDALAVAWYLPAGASPVQVSVNFYDNNPVGTGLFEAYLMDQIGNQVDQTFYSDEIAHTTFSAPFFDTSGVRLWNDLLLGPGWFYLVIGSLDSESSGTWMSSTTPDVVLAPGVLQGDGSGFQFWATGGDVNAAYLPASNFAIDDLAGGQLLFTVETPEPATWGLFGLGLALILFWRRVASVRLAPLSRRSNSREVA